MTNWLTAVSTLEASAAGAETLMVTGPEMAVEPVRLSVTPGIAPATTLELEDPGTPSTL